MAFDFMILGATGMQGRIAARDLLEHGYDVLLCGRDKSRITYLLGKYSRAAFQYVDMSDFSPAIDAIKKSRAEVVVNCMEGDWNLQALKACIQAKVHSLDLGSEIWMTKKQLALGRLLKKNSLVHITGCGSVPGIGNVMVRHVAEKLDTLESIDIGFAWDSNIKKFVVPFSIKSVIEEFTDPATIIYHGKIAKVMPLDSVTSCYSRGIGEQKCFNEQHPEPYTFYRTFKNKGLKNVRSFAGFPLHSFNGITMLIELGLGSKEERVFQGVKIRPVDFLTEVLKNIQIPKNYLEKETLWIKVTGKKNKRRRMIGMECLVSTQKGWEDAGCNIDTGMPASIIAQMISRGVIPEKGSFVPEEIVPPQPFFKELKKRGMTLYEHGREIR